LIQVKLLFFDKKLSTWPLIVPHNEVMVKEILHIKYLKNWRHKSVGQPQEKHIISKPASGIKEIFLFQEHIDQNGNQDRIDHLRYYRFHCI
jgi:hypothetical protein